MSEKLRFFQPPKLEFDEVQYVEALLEVILDSGQLTNGQFCRELEEMVAGIYNVEHAIVCSSGTAGLWIALKALKTKHVIMPSFTWKSLAEIVPRKVTWLDIDPETWLPIVNGGEGKGTYVINLTFGSVDDYSDRVPERAKLVYDACHCFGSRFRDFGDATVFSLSPTKPFTSGEGGIIVTDDAGLAKKIKDLRDSCARMSEIHAVIGQVFLGKLGQVMIQRAEKWNYYRRNLPYQSQKIPFSTSYSVFGMLVNPPEERQKVIERIKDTIEHRVYYEPLKSGLPNTDKVYSSILCLPSHVNVDEREVVKNVLAG